MRSARHEIGSLAALFAFEAAGRRGSFTLAAEELGVTQAAVSKQVAGLEAALGQRLFHRLHRKVRLTDSGGELFGVVSAALSSIGDGMRSLRAASSDRNVTIAATMTMSHLWLLPLLPSLRRAHPNVGVRVVAQDDPINLKDDVADLAIRFGVGDWRDGRVTPLFPGVLYAMASPELITEMGVPENAAGILRYPLITYDAPDANWLDWSAWLKAARLPSRLPPPALSFTRYLDAVQAAQAHQGVVLVWGGVSGGLEERGSLVRLPGPVIKADGDFYLVASEGTEVGGACARVADWLVREVARHP